MIIKSSEFVTSAVKPPHYPPAELPEIAFAGRSNAGKSSLINTLVNRKNLVKTSSTPGRTQLINFFRINDAFVFVDLPGFGYAKVPARVRKEWAPMVETYLSTRATLKGLILIMDIRRLPKQEEKDLIDWFRYFDLPFITVLTKADKLSKNKQSLQQKKIAAELDLPRETLIVYSSKTRLGKAAVWSAIDELLDIAAEAET